MNTKIFEEKESNVRSYCRSWPAVFTTAKGEIIESEDGKRYIDFFSGAGALNYGHNNDDIKGKLIEYIEQDGLVHGLDMYTKAKREFIEAFENVILKPKGLNYKIQFTGPTGTNAVEAALKLARKYTGRQGVFALMGAFHGMTLGSLSLTSSSSSRSGAGVALNNVYHIPAPYMFPDMDVLKYIETVLLDEHSGVEKPAAFVIETVQAEGGVHVLSNEFLKGIRDICTRYGILLIVDDIQVGCYRTGSFFSFERADIVPDMVTLSKSISGYGLPMAITLIKPELDVWNPGEHNGTFRGNQYAFVTATAALEVGIQDKLDRRVEVLGDDVKDYLIQNLARYGNNVEVRGIGFILGVDVKDEEKARKIANQCFDQGLIIERTGRHSSTIKILPPLNISFNSLITGTKILLQNIFDVMG